MLSKFLRQKEGKTQPKNKPSEKLCDWTNMSMTARSKSEDSDTRKEVESASDEDSSNLSSSESVVDPDPEGAESSPKKRKRPEQDHEDEDYEDKERDHEDEDYEDKVKCDDADELSDSALQRQSKRKPSKSRIKRIVHEQSLAKTSSGTSTAGCHPLPPIDSLMVVGTQSSTMSQASMVPSMTSSYLAAGQQRTPGSYKCETCGRVFRVPSRYEAHMQNHSKGKPFCCRVCGKLFASQMKLDIHKPVHERNRKEPCECPQCGQKCTSWRAYLYHVSKHTGNGGKRHACKVCGRQFFAAQRLRNHMQSHMVGKNFCCLKCGKLFESQKRLDTHALIHDSERKDPYRCVDCGKVYDDWRAFKQHMKTHGSEGVVYTCEICSSTFITPYEKEKHMKTHPSDQRQQCPHCSKSFWTETQLATHMRNKHRGGKNHECVICGRECARASGLKQHMKMHSGDDDFFCHLCGCTFQNGNDLAAHSSAHVKERQFSCDQCGKSFSKKKHYHRHLLVHAEGQQYSCNRCRKQFDHSLQLATHMASHAFDGQQKLGCQACDFIAPSQVELEAHAHTHGKVPPYVCGICGRLFAEQRYFRQHMKRHTARAQKKKLQSQFSLPLSDISTKTEDGAGVEPSGSADHRCNMCGQRFSENSALVAHIEDHKQSGLQMYMDIIHKKENDMPEGRQGKQHRDHNGSDDGSCSAGETKGSETVMPPSKTTIHFGMQAHNFETSTPKSNSNSAFSQATEQAMGLRMHSPFPNTPLSNAAGNSIGSVSGSSVNLTQHNTEGMEPFSRHCDSFYSSPVFPGHSSSYATPYHAAAAAAQQFHQHDSYTNGSIEPGNAMDYRPYAMTSKRLPDFSDFMSNKARFSDYSDAVSAVSQGASVISHSSSMTGGYSFAEGLSPSPSFVPGGNKAMAGGEEAPRSMPVFPSMPLFPHMPPPVPGSMAGSRGDNQYESMFQFSSLGN